MENKIEFDYLKEREKTVASFEHDYNEKINEIITNLNTIIFNFAYLFFKDRHFLCPDEKDSAFLLLRSVDYLFSAISLMKQRAFFETLTILRLAIETSSTAFHISKDKEKLKEFKARKYKSTESIKFSKKYIPRFGEIWRALSQVAVHTNPGHGIYTYIKDEYLVEEGSVCIGEKEKNEKQDYALIILAKLSSYIIYRFFELILYKDVKYKGFDVKYNKGSGSIKFGKKTEEIIDELLTELIKNSA